QCSNHQKIRFSSYKQTIASRASQSDSYSNNAKEYHSISNNHHSQTNSTNLLRTNREKNPLNAVVIETTAEVHIPLSRSDVFG
ncbi:unnamed protein product, partial [Adineta steineri]